MTTPTSRRRDVRASTAAAPAADEERSARFSPVLVKEREDGCRLLLFGYASGEHPLPLPSSSHFDHAVSVSNASRGYSRALSLATPRGIQPRDLLPTPRSPASSLSRHRLALPFTIAAVTLPPGSSNPPRTPRSLSSAPSRARYQPAAIPTAESRDRPRVVGSPPVSHPTRRHVTPRRALRVFLCIAFSELASERSLIARSSYRKSSARRDLARLRARATPSGCRLFNCTPLSVAVTDDTVRGTP